MKVTAERIICAPRLSEIKSDAMQVEMLTIPDTPHHLNFKKAKGTRIALGRGVILKEETTGQQSDSVKVRSVHSDPARTGADLSKIKSYSAKQVVFELRNQPWNDVIRNKHWQIRG